MFSVPLFFFFPQLYNCSVTYISKDIHADSSHISGEKKDGAVNFHVLFTPLFELLHSITVNYYQKERALQCAGFPAEWLFACKDFTLITHEYLTQSQEQVKKTRAA